MADAAEQLLVQLKAAASGTDGKNAPQLLHAAAESLTALLAELSAVKADQEQQLVRPSAWANRELKYKQVRAADVCFARTPTGALVRTGNSSSSCPPAGHLQVR